MSVTDRRQADVQVLLVEDNPADADLAFENLAHSVIRHQLHVARDGIEAMAFLRREGSYRNAPRPDLILLDLNLPRMGGRQVLVEIKADESLRRIPVIVLTSSQAEEDIAMAYDLHAGAYVIKPLDQDGFRAIVRAIEGFWFAVVRFPPA